jgi:nucleotide-binding universal stress UspA family protein
MSRVETALLGMDYLVAVDGSEQSEAAVEHAITMAECSDGSVALVHAVNPSVYQNAHAPADDDQLLQSVEEAEERGMELLEEAAERVREQEVSVSGTHLLYGEPVNVIPNLADEESFDGVVVGHRGLSGHYQRVLGSVAKGLIGKTDVPVTVVRAE